jgi:hypothetical protein
MFQRIKILPSWSMMVKTAMVDPSDMIQVAQSDIKLQRLLRKRSFLYLGHRVLNILFVLH